MRFDQVGDRLMWASMKHTCHQVQPKGRGQACAAAAAAACACARRTCSSTSSTSSSSACMRCGSRFSGLAACWRAAVVGTHTGCTRLHAVHDGSSKHAHTVHAMMHCMQVAHRCAHGFSDEVVERRVDGRPRGKDGQLRVLVRDDSSLQGGKWWRCSVNRACCGCRCASHWLHSNQH